MASVGSTYTKQLKQAEESLKAYRAEQNTLKKLMIKRDLNHHYMNKLKR